MWQTTPSNLLWIGGAYLAAVVFETLLVLFRGWRPLAAKRRARHK
jgi:hypothetical protein